MITKFLEDNSLWIIALIFAFLLGLWCSNDMANVFWDFVLYVRGVPEPADIQNYIQIINT